MSKRLLRLTTILFSNVLFALFCVTQTMAQTNLPTSAGNRFISFEVMKPNFDGTASLETISSVWFYGVQIPTVGEKLLVKGELPFVYYDVKSFSSFFGSFDPEAEFLVGNPLISLEIRKAEGSSRGYALVGARLPLVGDNKLSASAFGIFTDIDRLDAFLPNTLSLMLGGGYRSKLSPNTRFDFGIVGLGLIRTERGPEDEVFLKYSGKFWFESNRLSLNIGLTGIALLTEGDLSLSELTEHQLSLGLHAKFGKVVPGAFIRAPIAEELNFIIDFVAGVNLTVMIGD